MNRSSKDGLWAYFVRFTFIAVILFVAVFSGCYSGIFESTGITTPVATIPNETTSTTTLITTSDTTTVPPTQIVETTTAASTTETTTVETTTLETTTTEETTYPPVTFPTESDYVGEYPDFNITFDDITDEKMELLIEEKFLTVRPESRSGEKLKELKNIAVHYVGNPNTSAINNWSYFEHQKNYVSAHFIIGLDGEIIQCMPLDEVAWAVGNLEGNYTSISIECCHPDETGKFTKETYESLIKLVSWLCNKFDLERDDVLRHYDYTGKACPRYFVNDMWAWEDFKDELLIK